MGVRSFEKPRDYTRLTQDWLVNKLKLSAQNFKNISFQTEFIYESLITFSFCTNLSFRKF